MVNKTKMIAEPRKQKIFIVRELDAPRERVFKAFTDPKLYSQWLGPRRLTTIFEKLESKNDVARKTVKLKNASCWKNL